MKNMGIEYIVGICYYVLRQKQTKNVTQNKSSRGLNSGAFVLVKYHIGNNQQIMTKIDKYFVY